MSGSKDDAKEKVLFETTLVAEKGQTKDDLSPLAKRVAERVFDMVKQKGYQPKEIWEQTSDCVYITLRLRSLRPIAEASAPGVSRIPYSGRAAERVGVRPD